MNNLLVGLVLRPEIAAMAMSGSLLIVAVNAPQLRCTQRGGSPQT